MRCRNRQNIFNYFQFTFSLSTRIKKNSTLILESLTILTCHIFNPEI